MKFFIIPTVLIGLTMGTATMAAIAPAVAEPATPVEKRQVPTDPAALSSLLADPSAAFAQATSLLANPQVSSQFRQLVTASSFEARISSAYYSALGSQTGAVALSSYNAVINSLLGESSAVGNSGGSSPKSGNNAASSIMVIGAMGSAVVVGAAVVLAAL